MCLHTGGVTRQQKRAPLGPVRALKLRWRRLVSPEGREVMRTWEGDEGEDVVWDAEHGV